MTVSAGFVERDATGTLDVGDDPRREPLLQIHWGGSALLAFAATVLVYGWYRWLRQGDTVAVVLCTALADVHLRRGVVHDAGDTDG